MAKTTDAEGFGPVVVTLIGMPGGGKSTVGRVLGRRLGLAFVDADKAIEEEAGCSIATLFEHEGEEGFRQRESRMLAGLVSSGPCVVATGGGVVLRPANRELLQSKTRCVYLRVPTETLVRRLRRDKKRPLLQVADPEQRVRELVEQRDPLYETTAAFVVETSGLSLAGVVESIVSGLSRPHAP